MIIGICGLIGSGKDTIADYLIRKHDFEKISFADKLKDSVSTMFDWDRELLDGKTDESRAWREEVDEYWTKETGETITPRLVLQLFGTECMRDGFYDGIWVSLTKKKILDNPDKHFVIPDVRFPNEVKMIQSVQGQVWQVRRGDLPVWFMDKRDNNIEPTDVHASEWAWIDKDESFEEIIYNDDSLEELLKKIKKLYKKG